MLHPRPISRRQGTGRLAGLLTLGLLVAVGLGVWTAFARQAEPAPQDLLSVDLGGNDAKPMRIYGNHLTEWQEGDERIILMRGKVWVEQDLVRLCLQEGVAWISVENKDGAAIYHVDIYGETADLEQGTMRRTAARARLKTTAAGFLLKTYAGDIQHASARGDPLFARGQSVRAPGWTQSAARQSLAAVPPNLPAVTPALPVDGQTDVTPNLRLTGAQTEGPPPLGSVAPLPLQPVGQAPPPGPAPVPQPGAAPPFGAPAPAVSPAVPFGAPPPPPPVPPGLQPSAELPITPVVVVPVPGPLPGQPGAVPAPAEEKDKKAPAPVRVVNIRSRDGGPWSATKKLQLNGESVYIIPYGVSIWVTDPATKKIVIDIEADRLVYWSKDGGQDPLGKMQRPEGDKTNTMEFYLSGHVQIRNQRSAKEWQTMRADEVYYDVSRNVAVAINADVEMISEKAMYPTHFQAKVVKEIGPNQMIGENGMAFVAPFPADPGIKIVFDKAVLDKLETPRTTIFGQLYTLMKNGQTDTTPQKVITFDNAITYVEGVPISYFPTLKADPDKPLGPLEGIGVNYSTIFGFQLMTTWNVFDLIGIVPDTGKKWQVYLDYMSLRGPGLGTTYKDEGKNLFKDWFGWDNKYEINVKLYGNYDTGLDQIGGARGTQEQITPTTAIPINHPDERGRALMQLDLRDLPNYFAFQFQAAAISDVNYLDQFNNSEWINGLNQDTFAYLKQQKDFWYWSVMAEDRIRPWITETNWLPKADGYVAGVDLLNLLTWNSKVDAGYAQLNTASNVSPAYFPTDVPISTARLDWWQDFSLPFSLGDSRWVPYVVTDLTYYSEDLAGEQVGRVYGGAGLRGSVPMSRLFPDVQSDLMNLDGIFHKIVLSGNYYFAYTNVHQDQLPQLDRLNDDASDQALRDIRPLQSVLNPSNAAFLTTSRLFDPQLYALQRLVDTQVDTLDSIDVLQLNLSQRWQTKRGVAGDESVIDWMTFDLGVAIFPQAGRDNFNQPLGFLSYDWVWNVGDRTSLFSNGWMDPVSGGPHFWTMGAMYNRPDKTSFTLAYRQIDPLDSKAVIASVTYPLNAKYAITGSTMYDFGVNTQVNTLMVTRIGTDLRVSAGFSYNTILNSVGIMFEIVPNLIPGAGKGGGFGSGSSGSTGGFGNAGR